MFVLNKKVLSFGPIVASACVLGLLSSGAYASGFQVFSQDAKSIGLVDAGDAANADEASAAFYNPASMTHFDDITVSTGVTYIGLKAQYNGCTDPDTCYVDVLNDNVHLPITGNVAGDTDNYLPNFAIIVPAGDQFSFGFSVSVPFGLSTDYPANSEDESAAIVGDYATETSFKTINMNPSVAYAVSSKLSIGLGLDVLYGQAVYDNNELQNDLSGWGCGYDLGLMYDLSSKTRVGLSYHSKINITATGDSTADNDIGVPATTQASAFFPLPAYTSLGVTEQLTEKLKVLASVYYTQWDTLDTITLNNVAPGRETLLVPQDFKNTFFYSVGATYQVNPKLQVNTAIGFDKTPSQDGARDIRLPDSDRTSVGFGVSWQPSVRWTLDAGYQHIFMDDADIDAEIYIPAGNIDVEGIHGSASSSANVFGLQASFKFHKDT